MKFHPEIFGSAIVAVGSFNPAIFTPDWLLSGGLIGKGDRDAAIAGGGNNFVISKQAAAFETDWFGIQVLDNQFTLASKGALTPALRDLAEGVFQTVPHTPVTALGLNFLGHFPMGNEALYHKVGDVLAPKDIWHTVYPGEMDAGLGDLQVFVRKGKRADPSSSPDRVTIQVQPSSKVKLGIFLASNDHRAKVFDSNNKTTNAGMAAQVIHSDWEGAWKEAERVFDSLLDAAVSV